MGCEFGHPRRVGKEGKMSLEKEGKKWAARRIGPAVDVSKKKRQKAKKKGNPPRFVAVETKKSAEKNRGKKKKL